MFLLGLWLWDNHLGHPVGQDRAGDRADTWELAMRKADRDLRLADGTRHLAPWVRPLLGIEPLPQTLDRRIEAFEELVRTRHPHQTDPETRRLDEEGAYALAVMIAVRHGGEPSAASSARLGPASPPPAEEVISRFIRGREHWWDLAYLQALDRPESIDAARLLESRTYQLVGNTLKARGTVLALTLGGLVFLPVTLLGFFRRNPPAPLNYSHRWNLSNGLGVFLIAYSASIGLESLLDQGLGRVDPDGEPLPWMAVSTGLAALASLLPALLALALLFCRPRHALSRLGLADPIDVGLVLGAFALLRLIDFGLRQVLDPTGPVDPTGGLSRWETGSWGLVFGLVTFCLAAPVAGEIVYRGVLFRSLANRLRVWPAALISALVFALAHFVPWTSLIPFGLLGLACALVYSSSRSLSTAIALHVLHNAAIKIPEWIVYQTPLS